MWSNGTARQTRTFLNPQQSLRSKGFCDVHGKYYYSGVKGRGDSPPLPLIGAAEIISIPPSIRFIGKGAICLWLQCLAPKYRERWAILLL